MSPRTRPRGRVAAGVYWNEDRQAYYLRFRATIYHDQVENRTKPGKRVVHSTRQIHRCSDTPQDWELSVNQARDLRKEIESEMLEAAQREHGERTREKTFGELADAYERDAVDRGTRWDKERSRWKVLVTEIDRDTPVGKITPARVLEWRQE